MDREVSRTLGELERKIAELERTLRAIAGGETPGASPGAAPRRAARRAAGRPPPSRRTRSRLPARAGGGSSTRRTSHRRSARARSAAHVAPRRAGRPPPRRPSPAAAPGERGPRSGSPRPRPPGPPARRSPERCRAAPFSRPAGAHGARSHPGLRRAARAPKLPGCVEAHRTHHLLRPRRSLARHRRCAGPQRCSGEGVRERPCGHDRLRHLDRLPAAARLDRRPPRGRARARARHQRLDAGRRVPVRAARRRRRRGRGGAPDLRPHAARRCASAARSSTRSSCSPTGSTPTRSPRLLGRAAGASRSSPTSSPTSRTPPATRSPRRSARRCSRSPPSTTSSCSRTTPTSSCASAARPLPTMLSIDPSTWCTPRRSRRPSAPGIRVGYLVGPPDLIARDRQAGDEHVHLAEHGLPVDRLRVLRLGRDRRSIETVKRRSPSARRRSATRCARELPEAEFVAPQGGYFMWVTLPAGHRRAARSSRPPPSAGWRS